MNWKPWLSTFFIVIIAVGEIFAIPIIINENVVFEVINPIEETTTMIIQHHKHRHRRHHHHHHKKRRSLTSKPEQETQSTGRRNKQMMLTKPYWPWP